jgi:5-methyltetrahydropteroyltriglutamate--homocysteine methyltransferase
MGDRKGFSFAGFRARGYIASSKEALEAGRVLPDRQRVLEKLRTLLRPGQFLYVGVTDPIDSAIESPETVRDRVLEAAEFIPIDALGPTDDCGFSPFADDTSTPREMAFAKIKSRIEGTAMAAKALGV